MSNLNDAADLEAFKSWFRMRRYLLFANYYSCTVESTGGWCDYIGSFPTLLAAREAANGYDWFHIIDTAFMERII